MKTCFNTITAGRNKPLEEIIRQSAQVGFDGLEIDQNHIADCLKRMTTSELRSRLEEAGLQAVSIMAFNLAPFDDPAPGIAKIKEGVEYAHHLGAPLLLVFCAADIPKGMSSGEAFERAAERAAAYAEIANPLEIGLEPIGRTTLMGGPAAALNIAARSRKPNVGIVMDTFHFYRSQVPEPFVPLPRSVVTPQSTEDRNIGPTERHRNRSAKVRAELLSPAPESRRAHRPSFRYWRRRRHSGE